MKKIKAAVTDSGKEIVYDQEKTGARKSFYDVSFFSGKEIRTIETMYEGKGYAEFKADLAEVVNAFLDPIRARARSLQKIQHTLRWYLTQGTARAIEESEKYDAARA